MEDKYKRFLCREYVALWKGFGVDSLPEKEFTMPVAGKTAVTPARAKRSKRPTLEQVRKELGEGCGCTLCPTRKNLVFGDGNAKARLVFVGEGPGADEDAQGIPFVGRAGQLLNKIIEAMGLRREDVYIANVVKCRPPQNRVPAPDEIAKCTPFLKAQLEAIAPQLIVALGSTAALTLVGTQGPLAAIRGKMQTLCWDGKTPVLPTYHPAYLLRNPPAKKIVWEDMKLAMAHLEI